MQTVFCAPGRDELRQGALPRGRARLRGAGGRIESGCCSSFSVAAALGLVLVSALGISSCATHSAVVRTRFVKPVRHLASGSAAVEPASLEPTERTEETTEERTTEGTAASEPPAPPITLSPTAKTLEFAIVEDYAKNQNLEDVQKDFLLFDELGVHVWRGRFAWDDLEPERGRFDFDWLDRFVTQAGEHGLTLRPYIAYTPEWAAAGRLYDAAVWNDPPAQIEDWRAFVRALVSAQQAHANIASYEIYNEENVSMWWDGSVVEYNAVLAAAADEIRALVPDKPIVLGGMVWPDEAWLASICNEHGNAGAFDVIAFHAYPETWTRPEVRVETYLDDVYRHEFLDVVRDCGGKPIWINETGVATAAPGSARAEEEQARWWVRAIATFAAAPEIEQIGIYQIKDSPPEDQMIGGEASYHLGLAYADRRPKLAFRTVRLLVGLLGSQPFDVLDDSMGVSVLDNPAARVHVHAFLRADGTCIVAAWTEGEAATIDLVLPSRATSGGSRALSYSFDGTPTPYRDYAGGALRSVRLEPHDARIFTVGN